MRVTPAYAFDYDLLEKIPGVTKSVLNDIFSVFRKELIIRLLDNKSYTICNPRNVAAKKQTKTITIRLKQINKKNIVYYNRIIHLNKNNSSKCHTDLIDSLLVPGLKVSFDVSGGTFNYQVLKFKTDVNFKNTLIKYPVSQRYKFPKE